MIKFKKENLLGEFEYEDFDVNVVSLTLEDQKAMGMVKTCCGKPSNECPKQSRGGSCCGSKKSCPKN